MLSGTRRNGSHYIHNVESETLPKVFSEIDDIEGRIEIDTDADGKILSYRRKDGTKVESKLEVDELTLSDKSKKYLGNALKEIGFNATSPSDWSEESYIHLPTQPKCALINISGTDFMPEAKNVNMKSWMEVWDKNGNYFKKKVILNAQGNSSLAQYKKNFAIDICEDDWIGDDTCSVKIGNWVAQDSFHFKAYYTELFKAACPVGYKLYDKFATTRKFTEDKPYKEFFVYDYTANSVASDDIEQNLEFSARCYPDGFPCIVYLNGEFYGIFSWQLKKHRDNFHMGRNDTDNIHLDGDLYDWAIWNGSIDWTHFEVRNPKPKSSKWTLLCQDGSKYDGDNPKELMGTDAPTYNADDSSCKKSAETKNYIIELSKYMAEIKVFEDAYESAQSEDKPDLQNLNLRLRQGSLLTG